jgi:hypothetical protein
LCTVSRGSAQSAAPLAILSGLPAAAGGVFARAAENQPRARRARSPADRPRVYRRLPRGGSGCRIGNGSDSSLVTAIAPGTAYVEQFSPHPPSCRCDGRRQRAKLRGEALDKIFVRVRPRFAGDSLLEGDGFEPSVPGEGKPTHASATFDRYRRLSPAIRHLRLPTCGGSDSSRYGCGWHPVHR